MLSLENPFNKPITLFPNYFGDVGATSIVKHPQPAFDLLISLPVDIRLDESVFVDWFALDEINVEKGDNIEEHPEVWNHLELPPVLADLSTDDFVSVQPVSGEINPNAVTIGLGLEDTKYQPEKFGAIIYEPQEYDATALVFYRGVLLTVGGTGDACLGVLKHTISRIESLGLANGHMFEDSSKTGRVSEFI